MKKIILFSIIAVFTAALVYSSKSVFAFIKTEAGRIAKVRAEAARDKETAARRRAAWDRLRSGVAKEAKGLNGTAGIVIIDLDKKWEISANKDLRIPAASMVKIPIMMSYFYAAKEGKVDLGSGIEIRNSEKAPGSGTLKNEIPGKEYTVEDLIYRMVTESDNTATNMLIGRIGFDALNGYFAKLGAGKTDLKRKMMDFRLRRSGVENYTTAGDMAYLLEKLYRGRFIDAGTSQRCVEILARQKMKDRIPRKLPGDVVVAHKTGLENGLCHDAGIVYTDKGDFLICVLTKHRNKSAREAKGVIADIALLTYNYYSEF
jgi:beta-lactamase class A